MRKLLTLTVFLALVQPAFGQGEVEPGKLYISPLPIVAANPAFGVIYGGAASIGVYMGDPSTTSMSSGLITATYSTKEQLMFTFKANSYTRDNQWMLMTDVRLFFSSQPTYGLGTGPGSHILSDSDIEFDEARSTNNGQGEMLNFNLIRLHQTGLKKINETMYAGVGYHLDAFSSIEDPLVDLGAMPPIASNHYVYSVKYGFDPTAYTISGVSLNWTLDTRDNVANPYKGRYAFASFRFNPEFLGSDQSSTQLWLEYRDYLGLSNSSERNLLALWTFANFTTSGNLPYMALPALGWDQMGRSGRAFPQGRFRGNNMFYAEAEWRFPLPLIASKPDLLGGVVFANVTTASSEDNDINLFQYMEPAAGLGLRIMLQKRARTNLTLDYGWGPDGAGAFYLNLSEYF
ncbi:MAG: BamA/TamA family outer membrane protein [Flavobacteriia bacterium]|nr:BamA/TamA family outer membrane protein [Flavobacteriia bacterium]